MCYGLVRRKVILHQSVCLVDVNSIYLSFFYKPHMCVGCSKELFQ